MDIVTDIFTIMTAVVNVFLVYRVFKYTQKMSQSKLSLSPEVDSSNDENMSNQAEWKFGTAFAYREEGFPLPNSWTIPDIDRLYIKVKNRGDLPSTKIYIQMKMDIYKTEITERFTTITGIESFEHVRKLHETRDIDIKIDYMGADEERLYGIVDLHGQVREVELILIGIHSNGHTYFEGNHSDLTTIYHYKRPDLKVAWEAGDGGKSVYGHIDAWNEFERKQQEERLKRDNERYEAMEREKAEAWAAFEQEYEEYFR